MEEIDVFKINNNDDEIDENDVVKFVKKMML